MLNTYLGEQIRKNREKLGLKQQDLASALQVTPQAVSKWERGENAPDISLLVPLAKLFGTTTDTLLGYHSKTPEIFDAVIFCAQIFGYASKAAQLRLQELSAWTNGFFHQITETVLRHKGIPLKYMGDTFLAFFSGPDMCIRAAEAACRARQIISEPMVTALNKGKIHLCTVGHIEYSRPDILGNAVNIAFMFLEHLFKLGKSRTGALGAFVVDLDDSFTSEKLEDVIFSGQEQPVSVYNITGNPGTGH